MTTNANTGPNVYTGNGSASEFDFTFQIKAASEVLVTEVVIATGVETVLAINTDYTVAIEPDETGSITLVAGALPNTKKIVLEPNIPYTQEVDYNENDPFPAETHESALDKSVRLAKQLKVALNRAVQQSSTATTPISLPAAEEGKALLWESGELVNSADDFDDIVSNATTQAGTATTQAGIATTQAGIATTQAGIATTKANEANASAIAAALSETAAETAETNAETAESNAEAAQIAAELAETNAAASAAKLEGTSTTSLAIGTGTKVFTTQTGKFFNAGAFLLITSDANPANFMAGQVTTYSGSTLTMNIDDIGGSGTLNDWTIRVSGKHGVDGGGLTDIVNDATPQLGGNLDMNGNNIQTVTPTEMAYVSGVTSSIQTQLGAKASLTGTETLTNKRVTPRVGTVASHATPTINTDNVDVFTITALAEAITSMTTNLSGTPTTAQKLIIRIKDDGTARAIAWGASFASRGGTLPTTTVLGKTHYVGLIWNEVASVWDCVAATVEA
jgi:hypothetical protein